LHSIFVRDFDKSCHVEDVIITCPDGQVPEDRLRSPRRPSAMALCGLLTRRRSSL
jgi:hypothetical protein